MIDTQRPAIREYVELLERVPETFRRSWDAIAIYDLDGMLIAGNAAARALVGERLAPELVDRHFTAHLTVDVARQSARAFAQCLKTGKAVDGETVFRAADGSPIPVRVRLVPARLDGAIVGVLGFARDIRALRIAESQFVRSEQQFRSLFEHHPDALAIHDIEGRFVRVNDALTALTGYDPDEVIGRTPKFLTGEAWHEVEAFRDRLAHGDTIEYERPLQTKGGERLDVVGLVLPLKVEGMLQGYCGIMRDVSGERRRERESARESKRIGDLYRIAAASSMSADDKVISTLDLARSELNANWAYVGRFQDGMMEVTHASGSSKDGFAVGVRVEIDKTLARHVVKANDAFVIEDLTRSPLRKLFSDDKRLAWKSFIGVPLVVDGEPYGAVGFMTSTRKLRLSPTDRNYARAIAALIGLAVQQGLREKRLDTLAFHDALTGLPNRALLQDRLEQALFTSRRNRHSFAAHYVDVDHFKVINDTYGHHVGDGVLVAVAQWLQSTLRVSDTVARIGGDEFVVLQPEIESLQQAEDLAAKLVTIRDVPLQVGGHLITVRLSVGVAVFPADGVNPVDMLRAADAALYEVKKRGRDGYAVGSIT